MEELSKIISSLDAYLLLSCHSEGLPISLLEVMSAGLPWIATDIGGIRDIATDDRTTRVIPPNSDDAIIKAAILSLASDIKNGFVSTEKQKLLYQQRYSARVLINQWKNVLRLQIS